MSQFTLRGDARQTQIETLIREIPDFPKAGIKYKDITPLLADAVGFRTSVNTLAEAFEDEHIETVVGVESRGLIFGGAVAYRLGAAFAPARKPGRLPADVERVDYALEYGRDALEMHRDAMELGTRALIVDDLLATGGTARATADLVRSLGGEVAGYAFVLELTELGGRKRLSDAPVLSIVPFD